MKRVTLTYFITTSWIIGLSGLLTSCNLIPDKPDAKAPRVAGAVAIPERFDGDFVPTPDVAKGLLSLFSDSQLKKYVNMALRSNPDLQTSLATLEESGFDTRVAKAAGRPTLTGNISYGGVRSDGVNSENRTASLDAGWEVDVWGRIRAGVQAASRDQAAIAGDYEAARQSIAAQTMQAYFSLVTTEKLLGLSGRRLKSFEETEALVTRRFESGTGSLSDVSLARTDVENTRAEIEQRKDNRDQAGRQLKFLTGSYPDARVYAKSFPLLRRGVAAGVPSSVMMSRPDIYAAYQRIRAADSRVTVAYKDMYPQFSLTASGGQRSNTLNGLSNSSFTVFSLLANAAAPLIDGGARRAEIGAADARAKQALSDYRSVLLSAFQEVENALGSEYYLKNQQVAYTRALKAAKQAEEQTQRNYESGLVEVLTLLDATRRSFNSEELLINTESNRFDNRISLALALGKGL